jgi:hypothetical protein
VINSKPNVVHIHLNLNPLTHFISRILYLEFLSAIRERERENRNQIQFILDDDFFILNRHSVLLWTNKRGFSTWISMTMMEELTQHLGNVKRLLLLIFFCCLYMQYFRFPKWLQMSAYNIIYILSSTLNTLKYVDMSPKMF